MKIPLLAQDQRIRSWAITAAIAVLTSVLCWGAVVLWQPDNNYPQPNDPTARSLQKINSLIKIWEQAGYPVGATFSGSVTTDTNANIAALGGMLLNTNPFPVQLRDATGNPASISVNTANLEALENAISNYTLLTSQYANQSSNLLELNRSMSLNNSNQFLDLRAQVVANSNQLELARSQWLNSSNEWAMARAQWLNASNALIRVPTNGVIASWMCVSNPTTGNYEPLTSGMDTFEAYSNFESNRLVGIEALQNVISNNTLLSSQYLNQSSNLSELARSQWLNASNEWVMARAQQLNSSNEWAMFRAQQLNWSNAFLALPVVAKSKLVQITPYCTNVAVGDGQYLSQPFEIDCARANGLSVYLNNVVWTIDDDISSTKPAFDLCIYDQYPTGANGPTVTWDISDANNQHAVTTPLTFPTTFWYAQAALNGLCGMGTNSLNIQMTPGASSTKLYGVLKARGTFTPGATNSIKGRLKFNQD